MTLPMPILHYVWMDCVDGFVNRQKYALIMFNVSGMTWWKGFYQYKYFYNKVADILY